MALIPGRCRRTWGTAKSRTRCVIRRWRRTGSTGSGRTWLAAVFAVGRFVAFTAPNSLLAQSKRSLRCSSSARSASRRQALAFMRNCAEQQKSVPHSDCWPPGAGSRGSIPLTARAQHLPLANRCRYSRRWRSLTQHLQRRPGFPFPQVRPTAAGAPGRESRPY
jgi:hypothetical protein